jgi:hypothetical protein
VIRRDLKWCVEGIIKTGKVHSVLPLGQTRQSGSSVNFDRRQPGTLCDWHHGSRLVEGIVRIKNAEHGILRELKDGLFIVFARWPVS